MTIGVVIFGEIGAGKDTLAEYLKETIGNAKIFNLGMLCRDIMRVTKVNPTWTDKERSLGQQVAEKLRSIDPNIMNDYVFSKVVEGMEFEFSTMSLEQTLECLNSELSFFPIIVGGRTHEDLKYWRNKGFVILGITADDELRKQRVTLRNNERNQSNNYQHFTETEAREIVSSQCDYYIINNGSILDLLKESKELYSKIRP
ncbi:hypothetical protein [Paenibacillus sp. MBLB4367]|uniref:hypothetical protein n=1 Tax=Paenibacillus sp. MBLB4367 TaxID=3384767 RepID=UPI003907FA76